MRWLGRAADIASQFLQAERFPIVQALIVSLDNS